MAETMTKEQLKDFFSFPFQDEKWVGKLAVAALLIFVRFIPFLPYFLLGGYVATLMLKVIEDRELALPAWDDLSRIFTHGIRLFGVGFIYSLPVIVLFMIGYFSMFLPMISMEMGVIPEETVFIPALGGYILGFGLMGIGGLLGFGVAILLPVAGAHTVVERQFGAGFRVGEWWPIFLANWDGFLLSFLLIFGGGMVAYYASQILVFTVILCCFYPLVISALGAYLMIVGGALFAQAYREGREAVEIAAG